MIKTQRAIVKGAARVRCSHGLPPALFRACFVLQMIMGKRKRQCDHHRRLDPALRLVIARAAGKYGGRIGGRARARSMTPLERSVAAMRAMRVRWARTTAEERRAWSDYMRAHQRRFWDGRTLPRKPVRERAPASVGTSPVGELPDVSTLARREPGPPPIPVVVIPRQHRVDPLSEPRKLRPTRRWDV
jgi:hypothetical protein